MKSFGEALLESGRMPFRATGVDVLQVNVGKVCNQTCRHCHVEAGPDRFESMSLETAEQCLRVLEEADIATLDITGGAPELSPVFRLLVEKASGNGRRVIHRCNLTLLHVPAYADLPEFLARHHVEVFASLPYYLEERTDAQRGPHVFSKSIEALRRLNAVGYGIPGTGLVLNLVYNPAGAYLPPAQHEIEADFRRELGRWHGVTFNALYTIANMPIGRFQEFLVTSGNRDSYMRKLVNAYNPEAADGAMCHRTVSVGWDGTLYDCDFNQMLELPVSDDSAAHITTFSRARLASRGIVTGSHCFACTAGAGSSCAGATAA